MSDLISRQAVLSLPRNTERTLSGKIVSQSIDVNLIEKLPSAQPERLTDNEQRIFLAAMARAKIVCKNVDEQYPADEPELVRICEEIERKVKGALWD